MSYKDKTVLVTGGANGIGKAITKAFLEEGATVFFADIDETKGTALEDELKDLAGECTFVKTDVSSEIEIRDFVKKAFDSCGKIDIVINNAGISKFINFFEMTSSTWDQILNTNLKSVFLCSQEAAKYMKHNGGHIVNIASTRAFMSEENTEAYSASKGGIVAITHAMARTLGQYKIKVNSVSPGWIQNEDYDKLSEADHKQHLSQRVGKPEDVASCCLFLCDERNDFITGENLVLDGGMTRKMMYEE